MVLHEYLIIFPWWKYCENIVGVTLLFCLFKQQLYTHTHTHIHDTYASCERAWGSTCGSFLKILFI